MPVVKAARHMIHGGGVAHGLPYAEAPWKNVQSYLTACVVAPADTIAVCVARAALGQPSACVQDTNLRVYMCVWCVVQLRQSLLCMFTWFVRFLGPLRSEHGRMHDTAIDTQHHV